MVRKLVFAQEVKNKNFESILFLIIKNAENIVLCIMNYFLIPSFAIRALYPSRSFLVR